jgi:hypothetical protein
VRLQQQVADKTGTGRRAVMEAEKGRPGASMSVYLALLWAYDLHKRRHFVNCFLSGG